MLECRKCGLSLRSRMKSFRHLKGSGFSFCKIFSHASTLLNEISLFVDGVLNV